MFFLFKNIEYLNLNLTYLFSATSYSVIVSNQSYFIFSYKLFLKIKSFKLKFSILKFKMKKKFKKSIKIILNILILMI
jgi:hypothetical protein